MENMRVWGHSHVNRLRSTNLIELVVKENNEREIYLVCNYSEYTSVILDWQISVSMLSLFSIIRNSLEFNGFQQRIKDVLILREFKLFKIKISQ